MRQLSSPRPTFVFIAAIAVLFSRTGSRTRCALKAAPAASDVDALAPKQALPHPPMVPIAAGSFIAGSDHGAWDEKPAHRVTFGRRFALAARPVNNAEFDAFLSGHSALRGSQGSPADDDAPATMLTWNEASAYCAWLSQITGKSYRLPTEAEWEYAFSQSGAELNAASEVENWCLDWYGPYGEAPTTDPAGWAAGDFRVTRGGTWRPAGRGGPAPAFIRSRQGALPGERCTAIGLRPLQILDDAPAPPAGLVTKPPTPMWAKDVRQTTWSWPGEKDQVPGLSVPTFAEPKTYVKVPPGSNGPLFNTENHDPALVACPDGDLLAIWYSTKDERGRELAVAGARLRAGHAEWDTADVFWNTPGRNDHAPGLLCDRNGRLYHFNGLAAEGGWKNLALTMRTSDDNGATWSTARFIDADHRSGNQVVASAFQAADGGLYVPCDENPSGRGGTLLHVSRDGGATWTVLNRAAKRPSFRAGRTGPWIAGIHAGVDEARDGNLVAVGRGDEVNGYLPLSVSHDRGASWTYFPTPFPPVSYGQRPVLRCLRNGHLLLVSFTPKSAFPVAGGGEIEGRGMFAALSYDGGKTWPARRLLSDGKTRKLDGQGMTKTFTMDAEHAEPAGYLAAIQTPDGMIQLISSGLHYRFNEAWVSEFSPRATAAAPIS